MRALRVRRGSRRSRPLSRFG